TWHGRPVDMGKTWYNYKTTIKINGGLVGIEDRDTWCFGFMYYRVMRALDFVKSLPEWDGKNLISIGGSLGGAQSTAAAALDPAVTMAVIKNPCFCEFDGAASGRTGSIPRGSNRPGAKSPAALKAQSYYDCVNFAPRIKCPVFICTGGSDELCPPSNVFAVYNAMPAGTKKQMFFNPGAGHYGQIDRTADPKIQEMMMSGVIDRYVEEK
ncbi:MAG: acetylxylan esterase, partial [Lentisphaeria bacterium]|nr:acetylxylan esterase [Lentisphaeria bacterium]